MQEITLKNIILLIRAGEKKYISLKDARMSSHRSTGWGSAALSSAVEDGAVKMVIVQAASFSIFIVMSMAWTEFFTAITEAFMSELELKKENSIYISLSRAVANSLFSLGLLFLIINLTKQGSLCGNKKVRVVVPVIEKKKKTIIK